MPRQQLNKLQQKNKISPQILKEKKNNKVEVI